MKNPLLPHLPGIALLTSLSTNTAAQNVCVSGTVEVAGPTICQQGETHLLTDTAVFLLSHSVNLSQFVGQRVRVEGHDVGLLCRVLDVHTVTPVHATLDLCGTPMPGCTIKLKVGPGAIGRYALMASLNPGYTPLGCAPPGFIDGTFLLATPAVTLVVAVFTGPFGEYLWTLPNTPSVQGVQIWFQGARQDIGPVGPIQLTDPLRIQIAPLMPPCGGINC